MNIHFFTCSAGQLQQVIQERINWQVLDWIYPSNHLRKVCGPQDYLPLQRRQKISRIHPIPVLKGVHISYKDSNKELKKKIPYGDVPVSYKQQPWKHGHSFSQLHPVQLFALISPRESFHFSFQYLPVKIFLNKHLLLWKQILISPGLFAALCKGSNSSLCPPL